MRKKKAKRIPFIDMFLDCRIIFKNKRKVEEEGGVKGLECNFIH